MNALEPQYESEVGIRPARFPSSSLKIVTSGLSKLLSSTEESQVTLRVSIFGESQSEVLESFEFAVSTPPSKITAQQFTVTDYEIQNGPALSPFKKHVTFGQRLDLLQVIQIKSQASHPVAAQLPAKLNGKLVTHFKKVELDQQWCAFSTHQSEWDETLSEDLYLIPLEQKISQNIFEFLHSSLQENQVELRLLPGEEKLIGLYGQGPKVEALATQGYRDQKLAAVQAVASCTARCFANRFNWDPSLAAHRYWEAQGFPGGSRGCAQIPGNAGSNDCVSALNFQRHSQACVQCAGWELQKGIPAADLNRRFCWGDREEPWQINKAYASVAVGTESSPILLKLSSDSTALSARFKFQGLEEQSPARVFVNFVKPETIQAQAQTQ